MTEPTWISVLPPLLAIGLAIVTRQVYLSLASGIWLGWTIMAGWNPIAGLGHAIDETVSLDEFSKGPLELTLRRAPNNKNEVVIKLAKGGAPLVIDKHDGSVDDFTHVAIIATEQDDALLVDLRYMR